MSKTTDKIKALLAQYEVDHPGTLRIKKPANKWQADIVARVCDPRVCNSTVGTRPDSDSPPPPPPPPPAPRQKIKTQYSHLRTPPGLVWASFVNPDGTTIPVLTVIGHEYDNYAAVKNIVPAGTYTIYKLDPRKAISYKCLAKDIKHYIEQDVKRENTLRENLAFTKQQIEAKAAETERAFLDQPGFYIVPGESVGPDDKVYKAAGPYTRFESAGFNPDFTYQKFHASTYDYEENENFSNVEDDALFQCQASPNVHVKIIEARNPKEAAAGRGHVWWQDGIFRGPPVDPRQRGFRF